MTVPNPPLENKAGPLDKPGIWPFFLLFFKIGAFTIGGGYAMIPLIRTEITEKKKWIDEKDFLDNLAVSQSIPGPIAVNFALMTGYRMMGLKGALVGLFGSILPSFLIILFIAAFLWEYQDLPFIRAAFRGIKPVIVALIAAAAFKLGRRVFKQLDLLLLFCVFLIVLLVFGVHPILIIVVGGIAGLLLPFLKQTFKKE